MSINTFFWQKLSVFTRVEETRVWKQSQTCVYPYHEMVFYIYNKLVMVNSH